MSLAAPGLRPKRIRLAQWRSAMKRRGYQRIREGQRRRTERTLGRCGATARWRPPGRSLVCRWTTPSLALIFLRCRPQSVGTLSRMTEQSRAMGILLPAPRTSLPTPLHCRSAEAKMRGHNRSGKLHRAPGFLLLLVLVLMLSPPMRQEGAGAGVRARMGRGRLRASYFRSVAQLTNGLRRASAGSSGGQESPKPHSG